MTKRSIEEKISDVVRLQAEFQAALPKIKGKWGVEIDEDGFEIAVLRGADGNATESRGGANPLLPRQVIRRRALARQCAVVAMMVKPLPITATRRFAHGGTAVKSCR